MLQGSFTFAVILWSCSLFIGILMFGVFVWVSKHKEPMPFWTGSSMEAHEFTNVDAYNRANAVMWTIFTLCLALSGALAFFCTLAGLIMLGVLIFPGIVILTKINKRTLYKYKSETGKYRIEI